MNALFIMADTVHWVSWTQCKCFVVRMQLLRTVLMIYSSIRSSPGCSLTCWLHIFMRAARSLPGLQHQWEKLQQNIELGRPKRKVWLGLKSARTTLPQQQHPRKIILTKGSSKQHKPGKLLHKFPCFSPLNNKFFRCACLRPFCYLFPITSCHTLTASPSEVSSSDTLVVKLTRFRGNPKVE